MQELFWGIFGYQMLMLFEILGFRFTNVPRTLHGCF